MNRPITGIEKSTLIKGDLFIQWRGSRVKPTSRFWLVTEFRPGETYPRVSHAVGFSYESPDIVSAMTGNKRFFKFSHAKDPAFHYDPHFQCRVKYLGFHPEAIPMAENALLDDPIARMQIQLFANEWWEREEWKT